MCIRDRFVTTDAAISSDMLKSALIEAADVSYNMVSVDGDTSVSYTHLDVYKRQA